MSPQVVTSQAPLSDQPWWIKTLVWVGVPTFAFGVLLYFVLGVLAGQLEALTKSMASHQIDMSSLVTHLNQESEQTWVITSTLARICINTAKNDQDRLACVTISRRPGQTP